MNGPPLRRSSSLALALALAGLHGSASHLTAAEPRAPRPERWVRGIPEASQMNDYACGPAVFEAVAQAFGHEGSQADYARELAATPEQGTHPTGIVAGLRRLGLDARLVEGMTVAELRRHVDRGDVVILDFQAWGEPEGKDYAGEWEDGHYAIAVGYGGGAVFIEDPSLLGTVGWLWERELEARWHDYEIEDGKRREYRNMAIVVRGPTTQRPRFTHVE